MAKLRHYRCYFRFYPLDLFCEFYCFHLCIFVARFKHRHTLQAARSCLHAHVLVLPLWCARFSYLYSFCVAFLLRFPSLFLLYPFFQCSISSNLHLCKEYLPFFHASGCRFTTFSFTTCSTWVLALSLSTLRLLCCLNYPHAFLARNAFCACVLPLFVCMEIIRPYEFTRFI